MAYKKEYETLLQTNRKGYIQQLKQTRSKDAWAEFLVSEAKQLNQRFYRLEKAGVGVNDTAYWYAKLETGKEKPRYSTSASVYKNMSDRELYEIAMQIDAKLSSETSTIRGVREVINRRLSASSEALAELGVKATPEQLRKFFDQGGGKLLKFYKDKKFLEAPSSELIDDWISWSEEGIDIETFKSKVNQMMTQEKGYDKGWLNREMKSLSPKKKRRRKK